MTKGRLPFLFIILTVMLDAMGIGLLMPVLPDMVKALTGGDLAQAAQWAGWIAFTYAGMQFLFGPALGALSDRYGRRLVVLTSIFGMGVAYLMMGFAQSILVLFAARVISGITGATLSVANAFVADISAPDKRAANFGLIGLGFGLGFIFGPALGGWLGQFGYQAPIFAAAALSFANFGFGLVIMPETLRKSRPFEWREADPVRALLRIRKLPGLAPLLLVLFIYTIAHNVYPSVWSFFVIEQFAWSSGMVGASLAAFGVCMAVVQGGIMRLILSWIGDRRTAVFGLMVDLFIFSGIAFLTAGWQVFALMPLMALGVVVGPALNGIMSNATPDDRQGALQGVLASLQGIAAILSPLLMTNLFWGFSHAQAQIYLPGAPFVASAMLTTLCLIVLWRLGRAQDTIRSSAS